MKHSFTISCQRMDLVVAFPCSLSLIWFSIIACLGKLSASRRSIKNTETNASLKAVLSNFLHGSLPALVSLFCTPGNLKMLFYTACHLLIVGLHSTYFDCWLIFNLPGCKLQNMTILVVSFQMYMCHVQGTDRSCCQPEFLLPNRIAELLCGRSFYLLQALQR